jgi:hypothetical protein
MNIAIPQTAGVDELRKMLQLLLYQMIDDGLKADSQIKVVSKLSESIARNIVTDGMRK